MCQGSVLVRLAERAVTLFRLTPPAELRAGGQDVVARVRQLGSGTAALCAMLARRDRHEPQLVHAAWFCVMDLQRCLIQSTSFASSGALRAFLTYDSVQHLLHILCCCQSFCSADERGTLVALLDQAVARASLSQWNDKMLLEALHTFAKHSPCSPPLLAHNVLSFLEPHVHALSTRKVSVLLWCMAALRLYDERPDLWTIVCVRCHVLFTLMDGRARAAVLHALLLAVDQSDGAQKMLMRTIGQSTECGAAEADWCTGRIGAVVRSAGSRVVAVNDASDDGVKGGQYGQLQMLLLSARVLRLRALILLLRRWSWHAWRLVQQRHEASCLSYLAVEGTECGATHRQSTDANVLLSQQTGIACGVQTIMRVLLGKTFDEHDAVELLHVLLLLPPQLLPTPTASCLALDKRDAIDDGELHNQLASHAFSALAALAPTELHKPHIVLRVMLEWLAHRTTHTAARTTLDEKTTLAYWQASVSVAAECCHRHRQERNTTRGVAADAYDQTRVGPLLWSLELADDVWRCAGNDAPRRAPVFADTARSIARELERRVAEPLQMKRTVTTAHDEEDEADTRAACHDVFATYSQIIRDACVTSVPALQCAMREASRCTRLLHRSCRALAAGAALRRVSYTTALHLLRAVYSAPVELTTLLSPLTTPLLAQLECTSRATHADSPAHASSCSKDVNLTWRLYEDVAAVLRDCDPCYSTSAVKNSTMTPSAFFDGATRASLAGMPDAVLELYLRLILTRCDGVTVKDNMTALLSAFAGRRGNARGLETAFRLLLTRRLGQSKGLLQMVQLPHEVLMSLLAYAQALRQLPRSTHVFIAIESALFAQLITGLQNCTSWTVLNDTAALLSTRACTELHLRTALANALCATARVLVRHGTDAGSASQRAYFVAYLMRSHAVIDEQLLADMRNYKPTAVV